MLVSVVMQWDMGMATCQGLSLGGDEGNPAPLPTQGEPDVFSDTVFFPKIVIQQENSTAGKQNLIFLLTCLMTCPVNSS